MTRIGEFTLSKGIVCLCFQASAHPHANAHLSDFIAQTNTTEAIEKVNNWKAVLLDQATLNLQVYNNKIYFGRNPHSPQVCKEATGYGQLVSLASLSQ